MMLTNNKGFTLIEMISVVVVLAILGGFTFAFLNHAMTTYMMGSRQRMLYQEASYIMERITRELRDAQSVSTGSESLTITKARAAGTMDNSLVITFSRDTDGNILRSSGGINRIMGKNAVNFSPAPTSCAAGSSSCEVAITLQLTDSNIPVADTSDAASRSVSVTSAVSPKNIVLSTGSYSGRCFNGDYQDVVQ